CLGRLHALLPLALKHLELLVVGERPLELLLRRAQRAEQQAQRVAALAVALLHRRRQVVLELVDQLAHPMPPSGFPPRMCQCRWKPVWPAPGPTFTVTR